MMLARGLLLVPASLVEDQAMLISALGAIMGSAPAIPAALSHAASFEPQLATALGRGRGSDDHRVQETGRVSDAPAHSLADDAKALVGDVFGALGANTSAAATPRQAAAAYAKTA
jgi:hypothetical protein